jgi:sigma-B regulation protein RsbU (phosphoserine phosphatase)
LQDGPAKTRISVGHTWFYRMPFRAAPWNLVYVVDRNDLWRRIWHIQRGIFIELMLGLLGLMALASTLTRRQFVRPTLKLIQFLGHASRREQAQVPDVPQSWLPWFDRVKDMMQESRKLMAVEQELRIAAQMQQSILPLDWPSDERHALHGFMQAARHVGGDFYDHVTVPGHPLNMIIGDVSGKGMAAALFGMVSKTQYRGQIAQVDKLNRPDELLEGMNRALAESNPQCMFVTGLCACYEPASGLLRWSGAGHLAPLLLACDGTVTRLQQAQGIALGLDGQTHFPLHTLTLEPGDQVLWFTDGVTESINPDQTEFGLDRLIDVLQARPLAQGPALIERIMRALSDFVQGAEPFDDFTCLVLHRKA